MFIAVPRETKPSWRSPPWMTLLLIALNRLVFFGWQLPEERAVNKAAAAYAKTPLAAIELPQFVQHVQNQARQSGKWADRQRADMAERRSSPRWCRRCTRRCGTRARFATGCWQAK